MSKQFLKSVGKNVRSLRNSKKLSQAMLAKRAGVPARYIGKIENEPVNLTLTTIHALAKALGVTPVRLLNEPPRPQSADDLIDEIDLRIAQFRQKSKK